MTHYADTKTKDAIQKMVNVGQITFICDHLIYHAKSGNAYDVGKLDDLPQALNCIAAYKSAGK